MNETVNNILKTTEKQMNLSLLNSFKELLELNINREAIELLIAEGGEGFYNYIEWLGLAEEDDLVVLSSQHHYYYDSDEMNSFKTVINLKELNQIKNIKSFLHSCLHSMPPKSNFIGCFTDNEKINGYALKSVSSGDKRRSLDDIENGIVSSFPFINMLYSLMDSKIYNYMSKMNISMLLEECGFKVINMTEVNGLTYFHSQKVNKSFN
jgi:hypothetical protein